MCLFFKFDMKLIVYGKYFILNFCYVIIILRYLLFSVVVEIDIILLCCYFVNILM